MLAIDVQQGLIDAWGSVVPEVDGGRPVTAEQPADSGGERDSVLGRRRSERLEGMVGIEMPLFENP